MQRLLTVASKGRTVNLDSVLQHELAPLQLSLAKPGGEMNSTSKAELISLLTDGLGLSSCPPNDEIRTCVLIDGHALIQ